MKTEIKLTRYSCGAGPHPTESVWDVISYFYSSSTTALVHFLCNQSHATLSWSLSALLQTLQKHVDPHRSSTHWSLGKSISQSMERGHRPQSIIHPAGEGFPSGALSPFARKKFFILLHFIRFKISLNFNANTKHSTLTLYSHFSFLEK